VEKLDYKVINVEYEAKSEDGALYISGIANTKDVADAYGDIPTGKRVYDLERYKKNPVVLVDHENSVGAIIGRMVKVQETDKGLEFKMRVMDNPQTDIAKHAVEAIKTGFAKALSIGGKWTYGKDLDNGQRELTKALIYEISLVGIGADGNALTDVPSPKSFQPKESLTADQQAEKELAIQALVKGMREIRCDKLMYS